MTDLLSQTFRLPDGRILIYAELLVILLKKGKPTHIETLQTDLSEAKSEKYYKKGV